MNKSACRPFRVSACLVICGMIMLGGCATIKQEASYLKEGAKLLLGISTQELETARKDALKQTFPFNYQVCRGKVEEILKIMRAYIYARDEAKKMIAIYVSESDTTPVGIFFTEIDSSHTQVEVSSHSTFAREFISEDLFTGLEKGLESVRRPAESNEPPPQFMKD